MAKFDQATRGKRPGPIYDFDTFIYTVDTEDVDDAVEAYTNDTEGRQRVDMLCANWGGADAVVTAHLVLSGDPENGNIIWPAIAVKSHEVIVFPFQLVLPGGASLYLTSDVDTVNLVGSVMTEV